MTKVALVSPPSRYNSQRLPLGLMSLSSYLTESGISNEIVEFKSHDLTYDDVFRMTVERVREIGPDIVGMTCLCSEIFEMRDLAREIRQGLPEAVIVFGGPHPTSRPQDFFTLDIDLDFIVRGEGEYTLHELIQCLAANDDPQTIPGLYYRSGNDVVQTPMRPLIEDLDSLPRVAYDKVNMDFYTMPNVWSIRPVLLSSTWVYGSRGCPFGCRFCVAHTVFGRRMRHRKPEAIVDDVEFLVNTYQVDGIYFGDESFTVKKQQIHEICRLLKERGLRVLWGCQTKAHLLDEELLAAMKSSGCIQIDFGIESGSDAMLKGMNKGTTVEQYRRGGKMCRNAGVRQLANMMINLPDETLEDIQKSVDLATEMKYNVTIWNVYTPFPGVTFGREMDLDDMDRLTRTSDLGTFEMLEESYKFGTYQESLLEILERLWKEFPNPRHIRITLNPLYWIRWFRYFSYLFDRRYLAAIARSRRKNQYLRAILSLRKQITAN